MFHNQTDLDLIHAVGIHAKLCLTVARRWANCGSFMKSTRSCMRDLSMLKRSNTLDAAIAAAALEELLRRRDARKWVKATPTTYCRGNYRVENFCDRDYRHWVVFREGDPKPRAIRNSLQEAKAWVERQTDDTL